MTDLKYNRILLKVSGEGLSGTGEQGINSAAILELAGKIKSVADLGVQLAVVVGGGNIIRGAQLAVDHIHSATKDYMGMLATVINALALQDTCESIGLPTRVLSSIKMDRIAETWIRRRAVRHLEKGRLIVLAAGTGNPHFTTDTAAAQRAIEINCDLVLKATKVDGVYDSDPATNPDAKKYDRLSYLECINKNLRVMDVTAIALCKEHGLPMMVVNADRPQDLLAAVRGEAVGTLVS